MLSDGRSALLTLHDIARADGLEYDRAVSRVDHRLSVFALGNGNILRGDTYALYPARCRVPGQAHGEEGFGDGCWAPEANTKGKIETDPPYPVRQRPGIS